ncbi:MAG TPA: hypothetical protein VFQ91_22150 [Bryobacteraceae bacterium]|nr:hypothetical protein [Bryobacteraceae bacterium]
MVKNRYQGPAFAAGDEVVLAQGTYQGTPGVFLNLKADPNWADIRERGGGVRKHPLVWLAHTIVPAVASATKPS